MTLEDKITSLAAGLLSEIGDVENIWGFIDSTPTGDIDDVTQQVNIERIVERLYPLTVDLVESIKDELLFYVANEDEDDEDDEEDFSDLED